jgi:hypothetical protein
VQLPISTIGIKFALMITSGARRKFATLRDSTLDPLLGSMVDMQRLTQVARNWEK